MRRLRFCEALLKDLALVGFHGFHVQVAELRQGAAGGFWTAAAAAAAAEHIQSSAKLTVVAQPSSGCSHSCVAHVQQVLQECNSDRLHTSGSIELASVRWADRNLVPKPRET